MEQGMSARHRVLWLSIAILLGMAALTARALYIVTSDSVRTQTNLILMTRNPGSLNELAEQVQKMDKVAKNIDDYKLRDIKDILGETARLAGKASLELKVQADAWDQIKAKAALDANTYREIKHNLDTVNSLQSQEIVRLRRMIGEAEQQPLSDSFMYFVGSFGLGIASSIASTYLYAHMKRRWKWLRDLESAPASTEETNADAGERPPNV